MEENQTTEKIEQDRPAPDKGEQHKESMIPKSRFDQVNAQKKAAEAELQSVADGLKAEISEEYADLIPDLPPAALIKWLRAATQKGLFSKPVPDAPDTKRPNTQKTTDLTGLSPMALMSGGYGKK
jgi:hypothetical protein